MMYYMKSKILRTTEFKLKKLGLTVRKISFDEINALLDELMNNVFTREFRSAIDLGYKILISKELDINTENGRNEFNKFMQIYDNLNEEESNNMLFLINKKKTKNYLKSVIRKNICKLYVIEIDEKIFGEYYDLSYSKQVILNIFQTVVFLNSKELLANSIEKSIDFFEMRNINLSNIDNYFNMIFQDKVNNIKFNKAFLEKIIELFNKKDIYYQMSLISTFNFLNNPDISLENDYINKVAILERIVICGTSEIERQFVLKVGILAFKDFHEKECCSQILRDIYDIRSYIVHGNIKELFTKQDVYIKSFGIKHDEIKNKTTLKDTILIEAITWLTLILKNVLKQFITNNDYCEYIKNN